MNPEEIVKKVSHESGVPTMEIHGRSRSKKIFSARVLVYKALREEGYSYPEIGKLMERDHTTVLRVLRKNA